MEQEQYIDHEVRLRVQDSVIKSINNKINLLIGVLLGSVLVPIIMHSLKLG